MKRQPKPKCPTPLKVSHRSAYDARLAARRAALHRNQQGVLCAPIYRYLCACRQWHLTRWAADRNGVPNELVLSVPEALQRWAMERS